MIYIKNNKFRLKGEIIETFLHHWLLQTLTKLEVMYIVRYHTDFFYSIHFPRNSSITSARLPLLWCSSWVFFSSLSPGDKCVLLHLDHSWIPTIRQNISDKAQYRLHQQANFPSNFETINMKCDSAQVYNVYGDAKLTLFENPTGSRIQILDTQTYKKIQVCI